MNTVLQCTGCGILPLVHHLVTFRAPVFEVQLVLYEIVVVGQVCPCTYGRTGLCIEVCYSKGMLREWNIDLCMQDNYIHTCHVLLMLFL